MGKLPKRGITGVGRSIFSSMRRRFAPKIERAQNLGSDHSPQSVVLDSERPYHKFRDSYSPYVKCMTVLLSFVVVAATLWLSYSSSGSYLYAWFLSLALSVIGLFVMSMPKYVKVSRDSVEVHCVVEVTRIPLKNIRRVHRVQRYRVRRLLPLAGSYGFGGFYGYFFDVIHMRLVRLYAKKLSGLIVIQDIYNVRYYMSCSDPTQLVATIRNEISRLHEEDINLDRPSGDDDDSDEDEL